eukprot:XP_001690242.1 predicted protein [Chlamydomonas reinhardtii]
MASSACKDAGLLRMKTVSSPRNSSSPRPRQICVGCASPAAGTAALKAYDKLQSESTGPQARKLIDTFAIVEYVATKGDIQGLQQGLKDEFDSLRQLLKDQRIEDMQLLKDQRSEDKQLLKDQRSEDIQRLKDQRSEDTQHRKDQHNELTQQYNQLRLWFIVMTLAMLAFASMGNVRMTVKNQTMLKVDTERRALVAQQSGDQRSEDIQRLKDQRSEDTQHHKDQHNELTQQYNQLRLWFIFMTLAMLAFTSVKPGTALGTILSFLPKLFGKP